MRPFYDCHSLAINLILFKNQLLYETINLNLKNRLQIAITKLKNQQMEKVIVRYRVKPGKARENEQLIKGVYQQLHREGMEGLSYATYKLEDGLTFMHIANYNGEGKAPLTIIEAFKNFQAEIKERCDELPVVYHVSEIGLYDFRHNNTGLLVEPGNN